MVGSQHTSLPKIGRARELRKNQSPPEAVFWSYVRGHRLAGLSFRRQHPVGSYVADFYCAKAQMVVELDGRTHDHRVQKDRVRDAWMKDRGILVVRVSVSAFSKGPDRVLAAIGRMAQRRIEDRRRK